MLAGSTVGLARLDRALANCSGSVGSSRCSVIPAMEVLRTSAQPGGSGYRDRRGLVYWLVLVDFCFLHPFDLARLYGCIFPPDRRG